METVINRKTKEKEPVVVAVVSHTDLTKKSAKEIFKEFIKANCSLIVEK